MTVNKWKVLRFLRSQFLEDLRGSNEALCKSVEAEVLPLFKKCNVVLSKFFANEGSADGSINADASALSPVAKQFRELLLQIPGLLRCLPRVGRLGKYHWRCAQWFWRSER